MEFEIQGRYSTYEVRARAVEAMLRDIPVGEVAEAYGVNRTSLFRWMSRFQQDGYSGLERQKGSGRPRVFGDLEEGDLRKIVLVPASDFGFETDFWTVGRVRQVLWEEFAIGLSKITVWRRLREAGLTYQKPERQYFELDEKVRQEWLRTVAPKIRRAVRKYQALLYFQDEANVSLTAFLGKTWAPCGQTPRQKVTGKRGGVTAMSAINGRGRLLFNLYDKRITSEEVIHFLGQMLKHHKKRHLVVVMDQAPPHVSKKTMAFIETQQRLHLFHLPKYSPDWNPDEKVWNHLKHQELKSHQAKTKPELKVLTQRKLEEMSNNPSLLRGLFFRCCVADFLK